MSASKPFEENSLQNASQVVKNSSLNTPLIAGTNRMAPILPPRPSGLISSAGYGAVNSYMPYGGGYGAYNSYSSYGVPYRSPYNSFGTTYGSYNSYGNFGNYPAFGADDHERRFIQYAEENSRNTFASVESIVRAFNSLAMMLDNTFFAMTSSFRAVLSVAENFGRLRTMFGHVWYSVNVFRFIRWLYRKVLTLLGYKVSDSTTSVAWKQATGSTVPGTPGQPSGGSSWPTLAFLGMLVSAPYIISKFLPKYEDKGDPANWKSPGIQAKAAFDFVANNPNELSIQTNDLVLLAPTYIQEEMQLKSTGWAFAFCKGKAGVVPLNYLVISKNRPILRDEEVPVPRMPNNTTHKTKRVSFGETQVFENIDLDYLPKKGVLKSSQELNKQSNIKDAGTENLVDSALINDNNNNTSEDSSVKS